MADPPPFSAGGTDMEPDRGSTTGTPRWVKVFGIIAIIVALLFVIVLVAGGGRHGPRRHGPSDSGPGAPTLPASIAEPRAAPSEATA